MSQNFRLYVSDDVEHETHARRAAARVVGEQINQYHPHEHPKPVYSLHQYLTLEKLVYERFYEFFLYEYPLLKKDLTAFRAWNFEEETKKMADEIKREFDQQKHPIIDTKLVRWLEKNFTERELHGIFQQEPHESLKNGVREYTPNEIYEMFKTEIWRIITANASRYKNIITYLTDQQYVETITDELSLQQFLCKRAIHHVLLSMWDYD